MKEQTKQTAVEAIRDLLGEIPADADGKKEVKNALEEIFERAGHHLEIGDGFAYAEEV